MNYTKNYSLSLITNQDSKLCGYVDSDWAGDTNDRKSTSGYIFTYDGSTISWGCKKQTCVSLSSSEAEYVALSEAVQEAQWLKYLVNNFNEYIRGVIINEDNQGCLKMLESNKGGNRTKHIDVKYHYVRDIMEKREMKFEYCSTELMLADILTKPLNSVRLSSLAKTIGIMNLNDREGVLE